MVNIIVHEILEKKKVKELPLLYWLSEEEY